MGAPSPECISKFLPPSSAQNIHPRAAPARAPPSAFLPLSPPGRRRRVGVAGGGGGERSGRATRSSCGTATTAPPPRPSTASAPHPTVCAPFRLLPVVTTSGWKGVGEVSQPHELRAMSAGRWLRAFTLVATLLGAEHRATENLEVHSCCPHRSSSKCSEGQGHATDCPRSPQGPPVARGTGFLYPISQTCGGSCGTTSWRGSTSSSASSTAASTASWPTRWCPPPPHPTAPLPHHAPPRVHIALFQSQASTWESNNGPYLF